MQKYTDKFRIKYDLHHVLELLNVDICSGMAYNH